jgi:hypothetical protein
MTMAYEHDEIVRPIGDGFSIAWDTTHVDEALEAKMRAFASEQSAKLHELIFGADEADQATNGASAGRKRTADTTRRRRSHAAA